MSAFLAGTRMNVWILSTTPLFLAAFAALTVWVYRRSRSKHYEQMGELPLEN